MKLLLIKISNILRRNLLMWYIFLESLSRILIMPLTFLL